MCWAPTSRPGSGCSAVTGSPPVLAPSPRQLLCVDSPCVSLQSDVSVGHVSADHGGVHGGGGLGGGPPHPPGLGQTLAGQLFSVKLLKQGRKPGQRSRCPLLDAGACTSVWSVHVGLTYFLLPGLARFLQPGCYDWIPDGSCCCSRLDPPPPQASHLQEQVRSPPSPPAAPPPPRIFIPVNSLVFTTFCKFVMQRACLFLYMWTCNMLRILHSNKS